MTKLLSGLLLISLVIFDLQASKIEDWKTSTKNWSAAKNEELKAQRDASMSEAASDKPEGLQNTATALNTIVKTADAFGASRSIVDNMKSVAIGVNLYLNDEWEAYIAQSVLDTLTGTEKKLFNICYKKKGFSKSPSVDLCSLIPTFDIDPCSKMPDIPGFTKIKSSSLDDFLFNDTVNAIASSPWLNLKKLCEEKFAKKKKNPKEKTSNAEKILNADPVNIIKDSIHAADNTRVKEIKNNGLLSDEHLNELSIMKTLPNGEKIAVHPFEKLKNLPPEKAALVKKNLESQVTDAALQGYSDEEIVTLMKLIAKNPTKINITFENQFQYEVALNLIAQKSYIGIEQSVEDYDSILEAVKFDINPSEGTADVKAIFADALSQYKDRIKSWTAMKVAYYLNSADVKIPTPTKDFVNNKVKGSDNELFDRMALVEQIKSQSNYLAYDIAQINLKAQRKVKRFIIDLQKTIIAATKFPMNARRIQAGLDPLPDEKDPLDAAVTAMIEAGKKAMIEETKRQTELLGL